jgi:hypothetical protein
MALRNIVPITENGNGTLFQYQYFGLAAAFRNVVLNGRLDLGHFSPVHIVLDGEFVSNIGFNRDEIAAKVRMNPIPAGGAISPNGSGPGGYGGDYAGGPNGWLARLTVGHRDLKQLWDWNVHVGYKWLESDAVIDAFTDSDFGLGGTNLKGYFVGANVALGQNVWATARWMSANQIAGAPYAVDILQVDINSRF